MEIEKTENNILPGYYKFGDIRLQIMNKKPSFIHRFFMNLLLGLKWHDK